MLILMLDKSVLNPLVASGLTGEQAFKTIQLGVILGSVGPGLVVFTITRLESLSKRRFRVTDGHRK